VEFTARVINASAVSDSPSGLASRLVSSTAQVGSGGVSNVGPYRSVEFVVLGTVALPGDTPPVWACFCRRR
jgi:hypothetical protein